MNIQSLNNNLYFSNINSDYKTRKTLKSQADIISFSSKKYSVDNISNPTNHCAYCGCKVYNEEQIESIARELLTLKADRLHGKIKSVLEKLEGAKHSEEIEIAKKIENGEEIDFFKDFLDVSCKKSYLKGEMIFEQIYKKNYEEAMSLLIKKLHPLLKTIDHISPQNRKEESNHADINLVEACYCCNHDLKKGVSFQEFYAMFPSIKSNMPKDKFNYAMTNVMKNGQDGVKESLSTANIIKSMQRLLIQKKEILNSLNTINYRISQLKQQIDETIKRLQLEIEEKNAQIAELKEKLYSLNQDSEFLAMQRSKIISDEINDINKKITTLLSMQNDINISIRKILSSSISNKKTENENSKQQKIQEYTKMQESLSAELIQCETQRNALTVELEEINAQYPSVEMLQKEKNRLKNLKITKNEDVDNKLLQIDLNIKRKEQMQNEMKMTDKINSLETEIQILEHSIKELEEQKQAQ